MLRPVRVDRVTSDGGLLVVHAGDRTWRTRTIVNATGTWTRPFVPHYPGQETFLGEQLHTVDYPGAEHFAGKRVLVVGGGASAVQFLGELAPVTPDALGHPTPPVWRTDEFDREAGHAAVALVEERVRRRPAAGERGQRDRPRAARAGARRRGARRLPSATDVRPRSSLTACAGRTAPSSRADAILWATGFRPAVDRTWRRCTCAAPHGGIQLDGTTAVADPRVQLVGYGPSASTIGANRAGVRGDRGRAVSRRSALLRAHPDPGPDRASSAAR